MWIFWMVLVVIVLALIAVAIYDVTQKKHAILRNFPVIGHFRYLLEMVGPELRQYIVTGNDEEQPFSRDHRRWVYASSKKQNNYFGFGSDNDMERASNYIILKHAAFPKRAPLPTDADYDPNYQIPCAKVLGEARGRAKAFRPRSVVNTSAMSFGSLSAAAVEAINRGCQIAGCLQNTGEGSVSPHHLHGGDLIWQIGTGYFGCRDSDGKFSLDQFKEKVQAHSQIKAIEIKLSQGAKAGVGGVVLAAKVTPQIAAIRGIPVGKDCLSPSSHSAFGSVDEMLDFVEQLADVSGLPVGIKSAVGESPFWDALAKQMSTTERGVDFITIDGGEGGSGAAPLAFSDHVALPFKLGFSRVYKTFHEAGLTDKVAFIGAGKLGFPEQAMLSFALGCDMIAVAREAMLAIGCIQAQRCHTGHCPTGVATQNAWLMRGLDPTLKAARLANYIVSLRKEILAMTRTCGVAHPAMVNPTHIDILDDQFAANPLDTVFGYGRGYGMPNVADQSTIADMMANLMSGESASQATDQNNAA